MSKEHVVCIKQMEFDPSTVTVNCGDCVRWKNDDAVAHTSASDGYTGNPWDTGYIAPGATSDPVDFPVYGNYMYHCGYHPDMRGTVVVQD